MTKTELTLASLLTASLTGTVYLAVDGKYEQVVVVEAPTTDALLLAATPEVREAVAAVGPGVTCEPCEAGVWDGAKRVPTEGWCCGGAFMPRPVALGLDAAKAEAMKPKLEDLEPK